MRKKFVKNKVKNILFIKKWIKTNYMLNSNFIVMQSQLLLISRDTQNICNKLII